MDITKITDIFDKTYGKSALIVKPANDFEINRCNDDLKYIGLSALPADYVEFLKLANGFSWNGCEFFGTYQVTVKATGYTLNDITSENFRFKDYSYGKHGIIVLGRFDDDTYVYDPKSERYIIMDSDTVFEIEDFKSFDELFVDALAYYAYDDGDDESGDDGDDSDDDGSGDDGDDADFDNDFEPDDGKYDGYI